MFFAEIVNFLLQLGNFVAKKKCNRVILLQFSNKNDIIKTTYYIIKTLEKELNETTHHT